MKIYLAKHVDPANFFTDKITELTLHGYDGEVAEGRYLRHSDVIELLAESFYEIYRAQNPKARMFAWEHQSFEPTKTYWRNVAVRCIKGENIIPEIVR